MKKIPPLLIVLFAIGLLIFSGLVLVRQLSSRSAFKISSTACDVTMTDVIASAQGDVYNMEGYSDYVEPDLYYLVTYVVEGDRVTDPEFESVPVDLKDEQKDSALQDEAWQIFADLIPPQNRQMVVQYNIFTDGYSNTLAAVDQTPENPSQWMLEIDIADLEDKNALIYTLIHEYAHLLTLNDSQVAPDQEIVDDPYNGSLLASKAAVCPNYFAGTGCSHADSYIHAFYNRFWLDVNDEWRKIDAIQYESEDYTPYYDNLYRFYQAHQDQFLNDYSTTHPAEDIAEAFTYFVLSSKPTGDTIKERKVAFFYEYPELIQLREDILSSVCTLEQD